MAASRSRRREPCCKIGYAMAHIWMRGSLLYNTRLMSEKIIKKLIQRKWFQSGIDKGDKGVIIRRKTSKDI